MTKYEQPAQFIKLLYQLDRGKKAQLRRTLGDEPPYWLYGLLHQSGYTKNTKEAGLVAQLFSIKPGWHDGKTLDSEELLEKAEKAASLGKQLAELHIKQNQAIGKTPSESNSIEQRFLGLLDADRDGLKYHLRQSVQLLAGAGIEPNWVRLLSDVTYWGDNVHKRWANDYYSQIYSSKSSEDDTKASSEDKAKPAKAAEVQQETLF